jgi:capsular exopolysaccharide synthesis family protein
MSIVEKAVGRVQVERERLPRPEPRPDTPPATHVAPAEALRAPAAPPPVVCVKPAIALDTYPALARDFRFLKRPVLARVFGLSRSTREAGNLVMITADLPQAGKSFVSVNLAASIAQEQMTSVLLIDADPVRRTLTTRLGCNERPGLMELLTDDRLRAADFSLHTDFDSLDFIPAGQPRPDATELLAGPHMAQVLRSFRDGNLVVILDSPPLALTSEARALVDHVHHVLVVIEAGRSTMTDVAGMLQILQGGRATVGLVLNKTPLPNTSRYGEYYPY